MFSVYARIVLHPVSFDDPETLVDLSAVNRKTQFVPSAVSWLRFQALQRESRSVGQLASYTPDAVNLLIAGNAPAPLRALRVSGDFFAALHVTAARGRLFQASDDLPHGPAVCVLSGELWQSTFGGREIVGAMIDLDGRPTEVLGILGPGLSTPWADRQIFLPRVFEDSTMTAETIANGASFLSVFGRLSTGTTRRAAEQDIAGVSASYARQFAGRGDVANDIVITPFVDRITGGQKTVFVALLGAVVVVLLVACTNTAALILNQLLSRQREVAVRYALGASRGAIVGSFLLESAIVAAAAGAVGVGLARETLALLQRLLAAQLPPGIVLRLNGAALVFAIVVVTLTALLVGLLPALYVTRRTGASPLTAFVRGMSDAAGARRIRFVLTVCEVTLSVALVVGAVLLITSLQRLQRSSPGFDPRGVAVGFINLPADRYASREKQTLAYDEMLTRLQGAPQVRAAAVVLGLPFEDNFASTYTVAGRPILPAAERARAGLRVVSEDYFRVMGIRLVAGRQFSPDDRAGGRGVCLVNVSLARRQFGEHSPIGSVILRGREANERYEIVGIAGDVKTNGLTANPPDEIFFPMRQLPRTNVGIVAKTDGDPQALEGAFRAAVMETDRFLAVSRFGSMEENLSATLGPQRVLAGVTAAFAGLALLVAAVGLYAVLAHNVTTRTMEIGIRMALGADRRAIVRLVLSQALRLVSLGIACGLLIAAIAARAMATQLHEVTPYYPPAYVLVAIVFWIVGLAASLPPAIRAARVDPLRSLNAS
jgi:predicted permease